ncbi:cystatin family protein [Coraliomargarita sp. W4R53]
MKVLLLLPLLLLSLPGCKHLRDRPGGYSAATVSDTAVVNAAEFAITAQEAVMNDREGVEPIQLTLVQLQSAHQQVVAGTNYKMQLKVSVNGSVKQAEALVWYQSWRTPDPYQLTHWSWK